MVDSAALSFTSLRDRKLLLRRAVVNYCADTSFIPFDSLRINQIKRLPSLIYAVSSQTSHFLLDFVILYTVEDIMGL